VPPGDVNLAVVDDSGSSWPLVATSTPGRFDVVLSPVTGRGYTLLGTVLGRTVTFATAVPQRFDLVSLPRDTITAADSVPCKSSLGPEVCFRIATDSDQLLTVWCVVAQVPTLCSVADGRQLRVPASPGGHEVLVIGANGDATRLRLGETVTRFGSAVVIRRTVMIP
jgi:hypothetical protein